jgi:phage major head subunit gpT-like protein
MAITPAQIRNASVYVENGVFEAFDATLAPWEKIAKKVMADTGNGLYPGSAAFGEITRKSAAGGYESESPVSFVYELKSERFGRRIEILADDAKDVAKLGVYADIIEKIGIRMKQFPYFGAYRLLKEGDQATLDGRSILCVDGLSFFNDAHLLNMRDTAAGTFDNLLTGTALNTTNFKTVYASLATRKDEAGKRMGLRPSTLYVPPTLMTAAAEVVYAPTVANGGFNIYGNEMLKMMGLAPIEIVVVEELEDDPTVWYLAANQGSKRPILWQETEALELIDNNSPTSEDMLKSDLLTYYVKGRSQFGFGDPRTIIRCEA